jgi:hypothetical protein
VSRGSGDLLCRFPQQVRSVAAEPPGASCSPFLAMPLPDPRKQAGVSIEIPDWRPEMWPQSLPRNLQASKISRRAAFALNGRES